MDLLNALYIKCLSKQQMSVIHEHMLALASISYDS